MNRIKTALAISIGYLLIVPQAYAQSACPPGTTSDPACFPSSVPEIDGSGAIIAIGLLAGLVALFRERFFRK
jgi:hypothetical protein